MLPRPASSAAPSSFRDWRNNTAAAGTYYAAADAALAAATQPAASAAAVPLLVLFPLGEQQQGEEGFSPSTSRCAVRTDGMGGLSEFFVPGSPTFVRTAQPALLVLSTLGGLAVLGALLTV